MKFTTAAYVVIFLSYVSCSDNDEIKPEGLNQRWILTTYSFNVSCSFILVADDEEMDTTSYVNPLAEGFLGLEDSAAYTTVLIFNKPNYFSITKNGKPILEGEMNVHKKNLQLHSGQYTLLTEIIKESPDSLVLEIESYYSRHESLRNINITFARVTD